ncbi:MAG: GldG family protein [Clostridia bacterium]|nr:GldG family protein [Clostridia bacterium]
MLFNKKKGEESTEILAAKKEKKAKRVRNVRRLRFGTAATVLTVVVIVGVLLLNVLVGIVADKFPINWDLSEDKVFTLSEESEEIAKNVKNEVEIVIFMNESDLSNPTMGSDYGVEELNTAMKELYTALRQYESLSGGKVTCQFINPDQEPAKFAAYSKYEVSTGDILFLSGERYRTSNVYETNNFATEIYQELMYYGSYSTAFESKVEMVLAANVNALQSENDRIVQVLVGHDEDEMVIEGLKELYELNGYVFEELSITGSGKFNPDAQVALIAAPTTDYSADEIKKVQQWVYNSGDYGRHLLVYTDASAACPNLYELLDVEYGIQVTDELILETDADRMLYNSPYYVLCDVPTTDYTPNAASTGKLFTMNARRLTTRLKDTADKEATISHLGVPLNAYPKSAQLIKFENEEAIATGDTKGAYTPEESAYPLTSMIASVINAYNNNSYESTYGSVIVSGCPSAAYSTFVQYDSFVNEELLLDSVNSVTGHSDSITISSKVLSGDSVSFTGGMQMVVGLGIFTVGLPVALLIICLVVFLRRKNL